VRHAHPEITARVQQQVAMLPHASSIYLHPNLPTLARRLAAKLPPGLDVTYFVNSGSEANDLAVMMARLYTGHPDVIAVCNGYHGGFSLDDRVDRALDLAISDSARARQSITQHAPIHTEANSATALKRSQARPLPTFAM
jgi:4-aminobutyrate aminotransferase-like enzyme